MFGCIIVLEVACSVVASSDEVIPENPFRTLTNPSSTTQTIRPYVVNNLAR